MRTVVAVFVLALVASRAHADQCAVLDRPVAERAIAQLKHGMRVAEFCEPCGEKTPKRPFAIQSVRLTKWDGDEASVELRVNGKAQDLAYLFLEISPGLFHNVAKLAGCPATSVSEEIEIAPRKPAETHHSK